MATVLVQGFGTSLLGAFLETRYGPDLGTGSLGLPKLFGVTPALLTATSFWVMLHGFLVVGQARKKYMELAKKDGEKDVEERYDFPNLYAQGTSKHAKAFNCAQRSHQHIFETFPVLWVMSLVAAIHYPLTTAVTTTWYAVGRYSSSTGYANADGDPTQRYKGTFSSFMWRGFIAVVGLSLLSSVSFVMGGPVL